MKRYLFFLRAYNDTDNIAPAIYFLLRDDPNLKITLFYYSLDFDFRGDENLTFLDKEFGDRITVDWMGTRLGMKPDLLFKEGVIGKIYDTYERFCPARRSFHAVLDNHKFPPARRREIIRSLLHDDGFPALVIFDQNRTHNVGGLLRELRAEGVKNIISLPVSPFVNTNVLRSTRFDTLDHSFFDMMHNYSGFDKVSVTDGHYLRNLEKTFGLLGKPSPLKERGVALGSIRYCPEWLEIKQQLYLPFIKPTKRRAKLVFFMSQPHANTFWDEVLRTIKFLGFFPEIEVVIKPHTRPFGGQLRALPDNMSVESSIPSSALIDWADICMFWSTSVALEAYVKNKIPLCLDYLNANRIIFTDYDAGWILKCRDDLHEALSRLSTDLNDLPYQQQNIDDMLFAVINSASKEKIPQRYISFMAEQEKKA